MGRVVYRGNNNANANGGVSMANANNDASNTNVGSRLDNYQSAYITGNVFPSRCREGQASATAHNPAESRNIKCSGRVW